MKGDDKFVIHTHTAPAAVTLHMGTWAYLQKLMTDVWGVDRLSGLLTQVSAVNR